MTPALVLLWRLFPACKLLVKAKSKHSRGGKTVTKAEGREIIAAFLGTVERIATDELG